MHVPVEKARGGDVSVGQSNAGGFLNLRHRQQSRVWPSFEEVDESARHSYSFSCVCKKVKMMADG